MRVADQNMAAQWPTARHQFTSKNDGSGAHVENNERA
jgi:hypothetical protein